MNYYCRYSSISRRATSAAVRKFAGSGPKSRGMGCYGNSFIQCDGYFGMIGGWAWTNMNIVHVTMDRARIKISGIERGRDWMNELDFLTKAKIHHFGGTVCPREKFQTIQTMWKATFKSCNCKFTIIQTSTILKSRILCCRDSQTWKRQYPQNGGTATRN